MSTKPASLLLLLAASLGAPAAQAQQRAPEPREARIPFAAQVYDFRDDGERGIYIQDQGRKWYYGRFFGPCNELPWVQAVRYETRGADGIDRYTTVIAGRERCPLASFVESAPPPSKARKSRQARR